LPVLEISVVEDVPTEILRYDLGSETYKQLQLLPTKGASDLCFLGIGTGLNTLHFLVVVNRLAFGMTVTIQKMRRINASVLNRLTHRFHRKG
jgi:hypothetical protein